MSTRNFRDLPLPRVFAATSARELGRERGDGSFEVKKWKRRYSTY